MKTRTKTVWFSAVALLCASVLCFIDVIQGYPEVSITYIFSAVFLGVNLAGLLYIALLENLTRHYNLRTELAYRETERLFAFISEAIKEKCNGEYTTAELDEKLRIYLKKQDS